MFLMQDLEAQSVHSISTTSTDSCRIREVEAQRPPSLAELRAEGDETTTRHPPRDAGFITWKTLCSAVVVQAFLFGFPLTFGVFQEYFKAHNTLSGSTQSSLIGVLSTGIPFVGAPFMTYLCQKRPCDRRYYIYPGWLICVLGLVVASFCTSVPSLASTQGLMYGSAEASTYGILFATTDLVGFGMTFLAQFLLSTYGFQTTLLIFAAILFAVPGAAIHMLQERRTHDLSTTTTSPLPPIDLRPRPNPPPSPSRRSTGLHTPYTHRPIFYILTLSNLLQAFAFYLPLIYLPSYVTDLGLSASTGATILAVANASQTLGELGFGKISDLFKFRGLLVLASSAVASISALTLWGPAKSEVRLIFFALIYGSFAAGLMGLWARIGTFFGEKDAQEIYSVMSLGRGLGNIASGPISAALLSGGGHGVDTDAYAIGKYTRVVLFVGVCMGASAVLGGLGFFAVRREEKSQRQRV